MGLNRLAVAIGVATRNDKRADVQSSPISGAHYLRLKQAFPSVSEKLPPK